MASLEMSRIRAGVWEGVVTAEGTQPPQLEVVHLERVLPGLEITATEDGRWQLRQPIPPEVLGDGLQTLVLRAGDAVLGDVAILAGQALDEDLRAEIALLRAELDLLKAAFRRHCAETAEAPSD